MRIIYNKVIPFKGFKAINLFGIVFVRKDAGELSATDENHEAIHTAQMRELGYVLFYIIYFLDWLVELVLWPTTAYRHITFEVEAYDNERNLDYLKTRKHYAQWRRTK